MEPDISILRTFVEELHGAEDRGSHLPLVEDFHEASSLYEHAIPDAVAGPAREVFWALDPEDLGALTSAWGVDLIALPPPSGLPMRLDAALRGRSSRRDFGGHDLPLAALSDLLYWSASARHHSADRSGKRFYPSGGGLYPLDVIVLARRCVGVEPGAYIYQPYTHTLQSWPLEGPLSARHFYTPELVEESAVTFVLAASAWRNRPKYGVRGYRYLLIEAGHLVQNLVLAASALGIDGLSWNAFYDRALNRALNLDGTERFALYLASFDGPE